MYKWYRCFMDCLVWQESCSVLLFYFSMPTSRRLHNLDFLISLSEKVVKLGCQEKKTMLKDLSGFDPTSLVLCIFDILLRPLLTWEARLNWVVLVSELWGAPSSVIDLLGRLFLYQINPIKLFISELTVLTSIIPSSIRRFLFMLRINLNKLSLFYGTS